MKTTSLPPSLRKAAVLVSALDEPAAEALLAQMGPENAAKVRSALMELDDIPPDEQRQVLAEFFQHQQQENIRDASAEDDGVTLELSSSSPSEAEIPSRRLAEPQDPPPRHADNASLAFLEQIDSRVLARALRDEHPQTVAVVIAQLSPARAAALLEQLPADTATDALERTAWLEELAPEIQVELALALRKQLAPYITDAARGTSSLARLTAVLRAMDDDRRLRLAAQLASRNAAWRDHLLAPAPGPVAGNAQPARDEPQVLHYRLESSRRHEQRQPDAAGDFQRPEQDAPWLEFADLSRLDDAALRAVFAEADPDLVMLALCGAEERLVARIVRRLPPAQATALRQRLEHPGPIRLREIEQARLALAAIASRLAHGGQIELPASFRFVAAV